MRDTMPRAKALGNYATRENGRATTTVRIRAYICARSLYIGTSVTRFIYNVQRPNSIYLLRDLM